MAINHVEIEGNLTREPEIKSTSGGKSVIKFGIAYNTRKKNDNGQWVDGTPEFYDVEFWPNDAQYWAKRLGKGVGVVVIGSLKMDAWEKDGQKHTRVLIRADSIVSKWIPELGDKPSQPTQSDDIPF